MPRRPATLLVVLCLAFLAGAHLSRRADAQARSPWNPEWSEILNHMSIEWLDDGTGRHLKTIRITGVNLQVVNGLGQTTTQNGLGNLVVGYNEMRNPVKDVRTGSHSLVTGMGNSYDKWGSVVFGVENYASGEFHSITGGRENLASSPLCASVTGGWRNEASGWYASVVGGRYNVAAGDNSTVSGGQVNTANGDESSIGGGYQNVSVGNTSTVSGGSGRTAAGTTDWVAGSLWEDS